MVIGFAQKLLWKESRAYIRLCRAWARMLSWMDCSRFSPGVDAVEILHPHHLMVAVKMEIGILFAFSSQSLSHRMLYKSPILQLR